jgi:predicted lysophospholipase L1 biosynthesis ABC-type transport system permease subunit
MTLEGVRRLSPGAVANVVLARTQPGPAGEALVDELFEAQPGAVYVPTKPSDLEELGRRGGLTSVLAALLAVMGVSALAYALVSSVRRRRRELAILKVLGCGRAQVSSAVAWQASVIAAIAIIIGVPLGLALGRVGWRLFAGDLGVPPRYATPLLAFAIIAAVTIVIAQVTAALPARAAARTRPSVALRTE